MSEKIPPEIEIPGQEEHAPSHTEEGAVEVPVTRTEAVEETNAKVQEVSAAIHEELATATKEVEKTPEVPGTSFTVTSDKQTASEGFLKRAVAKGRKMLMLLGMTGVMASSAHAGSNSTLEHDGSSTPEKTAAAPSEGEKPYEQVFSQEKVGHITLEGRMLIPQSDTTKEVYSFYFSDDGKSKNKLGEFIALMEKKGYLPVNGDMLASIYNQNKDDPMFGKKAKWLLAPVAAEDADDTRSNEKKLVEHKDGTFEYVLPANAVFPTKNPTGLGRYEISQGIPNDSYGFLFYKVKTTAHYQEGL